MLDKVDYRLGPAGGAPQARRNDILVLDLHAVLGFLRRRYRIIAVAVILALAFGVFYLLVTPPRFTASTNILIDARRMELFRKESVFQDTALNTSVVESELQVLGSLKVAEDVVRRLNLTEDPEFAGGGPTNVLATAIGWVKGTISRLLNPSQPGGGRDDPIGDAAAHLQGNMTVKRLGVSYVIQVTYTSFNPEKSARIANAIADAYIADQLEAKYEAAERAGAWLQGRIADLREQAAEADRAVQTYKAENNIISTGTGRLLSEAQVDELSTQLLAARNETAQARARLVRIHEVNRSEIPDAAVAEVLGNALINNLRQQYVETAKKERESIERYGATHTATISLRDTKRELQRSIDTELNRLEQIYKSNLEIATDRERALEESLNRQLQRSAGTMQAQVKLRDLESVADSYRSLYSTFLERYAQAAQQQSFPVSEARVITVATAPERKSSPKGSIILPASLALGLMLGTGAALMREFGSRTIRTTRELEAASDIECLGVLPLIAAPRGKRRRAPEAAARERADSDRRVLRLGDYCLSAVFDDPFSGYAETIRSIKVAADVTKIARKTQVIGVVSSVAQEGKTSVSCNLARLIAEAGGRTLIIDCDLRSPALTRSLAPGARFGLTHVLLRQKDIADVIYLDEMTGMHLLPTVPGARIAHTSELLASDAMAALLEHCRDLYDYIILDFPPILPVVDVRAAAHLPDAFVLVVEWNKTAVDAVREAVSCSQSVWHKLIGCVLNKADLKTLSSFEPVLATYYGDTRPLPDKAYLPQA